MNEPIRKSSWKALLIVNFPKFQIKLERSSQNEYFMPYINTYVDLDNNQEWALVNMQSNVQQMFDKMKICYWKELLKDVKYTVKWDVTNVISDGSSFKIFDCHKQILINTQAMTRPRIQLVSVLLHALIHIFLKVRSKGAIKLNQHCETFREIMYKLNSALSTQITVRTAGVKLKARQLSDSLQICHKFTFSQDEELFRNQWYQCTGICLNYEPFHGTVRSSTIPTEMSAFWKGHEEVCGGQFFRIFEMSRTNPETSEVEKKYVRNVRYMFPKERVDRTSTKRNHTKTSKQVLELFDLTDETQEGAKVQNLCDVVDLDASDFSHEPLANQDLVESFFKRFSLSSHRCPFCEGITSKSRFESHVDNCRGYQQKVFFNAKYFK
jgi:hypothetical protein